VLHQVDAAFGRILDDWQAGPHRDTLQIIVASDHGHITVGGLIDAKARLAQAPELVGCFIGGGGIKVPGGERGRIEEVVQFLMRQDWTGNVFAADIPDMPAGVLPQNAVLVDHARAGHVLYTLRNSRIPGPTGLPGTTLYAGSDLKVGAGIHGGMNEGELSTVLMLAGSAIRPAAASDWDAGLVDIAPTVLALLGEIGGDAMDGRVLREVFQDGVDPADNLTPETWEASGDGYAQRVARVRIGTHVWLESGSRT
jgi:arylsulfatase A-like enzyme